MIQANDVFVVVNSFFVVDSFVVADIVVVGIVVAVDSFVEIVDEVVATFDEVDNKFPVAKNQVKSKIFICNFC